MLVNATVRLAENMSASAKAYSLADPDGNYYIYINGNLCESARFEALLHEAEHIIHDDFHSGKTAEEIEHTRKET